MRSTQKAAIERLRRVQEFLAVHPPPESPGYLAQKKALDEVVQGLNDLSIDQAVGRRLTRAEVDRQRALTKSLRRDHLGPIAQIARLQLVGAPGIERALKVPPDGISPVRLVAEAGAVREAAAPYEAQFVEGGMAPDFLQQLDAVIAALSQTISGKARSLGRQIGGRTGMERQLTRGRAALAGLDAVVRRAFLDRSDVLEKWRLARRVHSTVGGNGADGVAGDDTPAITVTTEPAAAGDAVGRVA